MLRQGTHTGEEDETAAPLISAGTQRRRADIWAGSHGGILGESSIHPPSLPPVVLTPHSGLSTRKGLTLRANTLSLGCFWIPPLQMRCSGSGVDCIKLVLVEYYTPNTKRQQCGMDDRKEKNFSGPQWCISRAPSVQPTPLRSTLHSLLLRRPEGDGAGCWLSQTWNHIPVTSFPEVYFYGLLMYVKCMERIYGYIAYWRDKYRACWLL